MHLHQREIAPGPKAGGDSLRSVLLLRETVDLALQLLVVFLPVSPLLPQLATDIAHFITQTADVLAVSDHVLLWRR